VFTFGAIADIQYCDRDDGHNYDRTVTRRYRHALASVTQAVEEWKGESLLFVAQLGDVIDGSARQFKQSELALKRVLKMFEPVVKASAFPFLVHSVGNHELYNFSREELVEVLPRPTESSNPLLSFHSFSPWPGWRVLVMDPFDISIVGWEVGEPKRVEALKLLKKNNPNDVESSADWSTGLEGHDRRWMPYNGAFGGEQLAWLADTLDRAEEKGERAIVFSHVPVCPGASSSLTLLWNYEEVMSILHESSVVVAVFAGHEHEGGYLRDAKGIHHVTLQSPLECPLDRVAFASVDVYADKFELRGRGVVPSRTLPFRVSAVSGL
jgi:manganese-dependent ADP-ribose/CDP-alcohol diphosphatase